MSEEPDTGDFVARMDQMSATLKSVAKLLADYYKALRAEGFEAAEAMEIVLGWQAENLAQPPETE